MMEQNEKVCSPGQILQGAAYLGKETLDLASPSLMANKTAFNSRFDGGRGRSDKGQNTVHRRIFQSRRPCD